jgi:hypothetical protein
MRKGDPAFVLHGGRLNGRFHLVRLNRREMAVDWLLYWHESEFLSYLAVSCRRHADLKVDAMPPNTATLPAHIEETVATVNELHAKHYREAAPSRRRLAAIIAALARPAFVVVLTVLVIG